MDPISVITVVTPIILAIGGGWVKSLHSRMNNIEAKHEALDRDFRGHLASLPLNYVPQTRYGDDLREIKEMLREMREENREARKSRGARRATAE